MQATSSSTQSWFKSPSISGSNLLDVFWNILQQVRTRSTSVLQLHCKRHIFSLKSSLSFEADLLADVTSCSKSSSICGSNLFLQVLYYHWDLIYLCKQLIALQDMLSQQNTWRRTVAHARTYDFRLFLDVVSVLCQDLVSKQCLILDTGSMAKTFVLLCSHRRSRRDHHQESVARMYAC